MSALPSSTEAPVKLLYVEDDARLAKLTTKFLESRGLLVTRARTGHEAVLEANRRQYDVVPLDLMLPGIDGVEVCRMLRTRLDVPIIMVSARREDADKVVGLDSGADDYVTKPFSTVELLSRIRAVVRRSRGQTGPAQRLIRVGPLTLDPTSLRATLDGRDLDLTGYEFAILRVLAERPGRVLSREQLLELAKGTAEESFDRSIDVRISKLRQKLGEDPRHPSIIRTVRGAGYVLACEDA